MNFKDLRQTLADIPNDKLVFVGLGNPLCGDDGVGKILLDRLALRPEFDGAGFIFAGTNPENYLKTLTDKAADVLVFIDTARFNATPGTINLLEAKSLRLTDFSTHTFSIEMIAAFIANERPCRFYYLGIEPESTEIGQPVSLNVEIGLQSFFN